MSMTMAELLAKQDQKIVRLQRNQEIEGEVAALTDSDIILDLGTKSEAVLPKKDLPSSESIKVGDRLKVYVVIPENESGQVIVSLHAVQSKTTGINRFQKFEEALKSHQTLIGRGLEVNKGGLIVEAMGIRGFLPSSQVSLSSASNLGELIGKDIQVQVIEIDQNQNRLIFSQKGTVSKEVKEKLSRLKVGDQAKGRVAAVLPFGVFISLSGESSGVEGLAHISELSWERVEDPNTLFKVGQEVTAKIISIDNDTGRVNLSLKQLQEDPFKALAEKYQSSDVVKATVSKVSGNSISFKLEDGVEAQMTLNPDSEIKYQEGQNVSVLIDQVDLNKHRISVSPFITSTKGLIYK